MGADLEAAALAGTGLEVASVEHDTLAHADQPMAHAAVVDLGRSAAVVADLDVECARGISQQHLRPGRAGVLQGVREAFLDDAVRAQVDPGGQWLAVALDLERDREAGTLDLLDEQVDVLDARLRLEP